MVMFHAVGDWPREGVRCASVPSTFAPDAQTQHLIEATWAELSSRPGIHLFDGPMCRLEAFDAAASLQMHVSHVSYRSFVGTNMYNPQIADRLGWSALANPVGLSCALESAD